MLLQTRSFGIAGSGVYLPRNVVDTSHLSALTGMSAEAIAQRFGVENRHWADETETSSFMGARAAEVALEDAGWDAHSLEVIVGACGVMEQPIPSTSVLIQRRLGIGHSGIACFDVNATCLSFLQALDLVLAGFALGEWRRALIVSADIASAALDFANPDASVIFGDGAAAFALEANGPHLRLAHRFNSYGDAANACRLEAGGTRLRPDVDLAGFLSRTKFAMDGREVFRATSSRFPAFLGNLLGAAGVVAEDLAAIIPHQASAAALEHLKRALPQGHEKTVDIFSRIGNQIATSLPFALHVARSENRLRPGELALLIGSSAGVSLGGAVVRW